MTDPELENLLYFTARHLILLAREVSDLKIADAKHEKRFEQAEAAKKHDRMWKAIYGLGCFLAALTQVLAFIGQNIKH